MNTLRILWQAIHIRQTERSGEGEPPMQEMWLHPVTYDTVMWEAGKYSSPHEVGSPPELCGVALRRIGDE